MSGPHLHQTYTLDAVASLLEGSDKEQGTASGYEVNGGTDAQGLI